MIVVGMTFDDDTTKTLCKGDLQICERFAKTLDLDRYYTLSICEGDGSIVESIVTDGRYKPYSILDELGLTEEDVKDIPETIDEDEDYSEYDTHGLTDEQLDNHGVEVANGYGYYDETGKYRSYPSEHF